MTNGDFAVLPIPMILYCPVCGVKHVDAPEYAAQKLNLQTGVGEPVESSLRWSNPPHRSHLCRECGCIWRPADVPTVGVEAIKTKGKDDNFDEKRILDREWDVAQR